MEPTLTIATDDELRELILRHWQVVDKVGANALYDDDSVLEFPQSGERFRGRANIQGFREQYPARVGLETVHLVGGGAHWIGEHLVTYDDDAAPWHGLSVLELRGTTVARERIYFAQPFEAPSWRARWAEPA